MIEVTIALRAYDAQLFIRETIESILEQTGVDLELIIVNDGSKDETAEILKAFTDPRLKILTNTRKMGRAYCHNLAVYQSWSPFIVIVEQHNILLPQAIKKLVAAIKGSERIGQVHCYHYDVDQTEGITMNAYHRTREIVKDHFPAGSDYRKLLLFHGRSIEGLRIYRREVFHIVGEFCKTTGLHENFHFSLQLLDKFEISILPEMLYYCRIDTQRKRRFKRIAKLKRWSHILFIYIKLLKGGSIAYLQTKEFHLVRVIFHGVVNTLVLEPLGKKIRRLYRRLNYFLQWYLLIPISEAIYNLARSTFGWWPIYFLPSKSGKNITHRDRIVYYLWVYPALSETFIQREVAALRKADVSVHVISEINVENEFLTELRDLLSQDTHCVYPLDPNMLSKYRRYFFRKNPFAYIWLFLYVIFHNYHAYKNTRFDKGTFAKAIYLAGLCKEYRINHIHSPWADNSAFISLIAARLLGITYSVQARAHDIHRKTYLYALLEKFENADFVVTNSQYNFSYIRSILNHSGTENIHLMYNGLNLEQFIPDGYYKKLSNPTRILCVARLIEQKGLIYLLKACNILKQKGYSFECKIIGGPEKPLFMKYYVALKKLHSRLRLQDCVFFAGSQSFSRILEAYKNADIFVLPCVLAENGSRDITPNSLLEAMAMRLPVVSTHVTAIPEIVEDGVSGLLVPPNDEKAIAEALLKLINDVDLCRKLAENARKNVEERFNIDKNIEKYISLFKRGVVQYSFD